MIPLTTQLERLTEKARRVKDVEPVPVVEDKEWRAFYRDDTDFCPDCERLVRLVELRCQECGFDFINEAIASNLSCPGQTGGAGKEALDAF